MRFPALAGLLIQVDTCKEWQWDPLQVRGMGRASALLGSHQPSPLSPGMVKGGMPAEQMQRPLVGKPGSALSVSWKSRAFRTGMGHRHRPLSRRTWSRPLTLPLFKKESGTKIWLSKVLA